MELDKIMRDAIVAAVNAPGYNQSRLGEKSGVSQRNISRYISGQTNSISDRIWRDLFPFVKEYLPPEYQAAYEEGTQKRDKVAPPAVPNTIRNTPELRECIKDAMLEKGIRGAVELCKQIGYDTPKTLERLLSGKINWFPDMLSAVLDNLEISHDDAPITPTERELLHPQGIYFNDGSAMVRAVLVHYLPVISWANAASYIDCMMAHDGVAMRKWNPEEVEETVPVPLDIRGDCFVFRVSGQSMEPSINDGDILFCEEILDINQISDRRVVVVKFADCSKYSDCIVCKRFRRIGDKILLSSDNPAGREFEPELQDIAWIGIVRRKTVNGDSL